MKITSTTTPATSRTMALGVISQNHRYVGTLVSRQNGKQRKFALVTTTNKGRLRQDPPSADNLKKELGATNKISPTKLKLTSSSSGSHSNEVKPAVSMNGNCTLNLQIKSLPRLTSSTSTGSKMGRITVTSRSSSSSSSDISSLVRVSTAPTLTTACKDLKENTIPEKKPAVVTKRRLVSLDGVSMVTNTGVLRHKESLKRPSSAADHHQLPVKLERLDSVDLTSLQAFQPVSERLIISKDSVTAKKGGSSTAATTTAFKKIKTALNIGSFATIDTSTLLNTTSTTPVVIKQEQRQQAPPPKKIRLTTATTGGDTTPCASDEEQVRQSHNVLERQRREGLRASFVHLKNCIPTMGDMNRTPKVLILKQAKQYCEGLRQEALELLTEKSQLERRRAELVQRLHALSPEHVPDTLKHIATQQGGVPTTTTSPVNIQQPPPAAVLPPPAPVTTATYPLNVITNSHHQQPINAAVAADDDDDNDCDQQISEEDAVAYLLQAEAALHESAASNNASAASNAAADALSVAAAADNLMQQSLSECSSLSPLYQDENDMLSDLEDLITSEDGSRRNSFEDFFQ